MLIISVVFFCFFFNLKIFFFFFFLIISDSFNLTHITQYKSTKYSIHTARLNVSSALCKCQSIGREDLCFRVLLRLLERATAWVFANVNSTLSF